MEVQHIFAGCQRKTGNGQWRKGRKNGQTIKRQITNGLRPSEETFFRASSTLKQQGPLLTTKGVKSLVPQFKYLTLGEDLLDDFRQNRYVSFCMSVVLYVYVHV